MAINSVLEILVCPKCSSNIAMRKGYLECVKCGAKYSVIDDRIIDFMGSNQGWIGFFERFPGLYDPWSRIGWRLSGKGSLYRFYEELTRDLRSGVLIDAGCGTGSLISILEKRKYQGIIIGIDISLPMLKMASRKTRNAVLLRASIDRIPVASESVDHYVSSLVLHILKDKEKAVAEISRVLKSEGSVRIAVAVSDNAKGRVFSRLLKVYAISSSDYVALLGAHGIKIIREAEFGAFKAFYGIKRSSQ